MTSDKGAASAQTVLDNVNILLAGQTGVGRSTLINMITGATDGSAQAARVSNDAIPCPIETTVRTATLKVEERILHCNFSDTRGLDEATDHPNFVDMAANWLRQQAFGLSPKHQSERDLQKICRERTSGVRPRRGNASPSASTVILMWCIHASKIDVPIHWQHFRRVYLEYCQKKVKPVVVITQMTPEFAEEWEERCKDQLDALNLGIALEDVNSLFLAVRRYRSTSSSDYTNDCLALRDLIFRLSDRT